MEEVGLAFGELHHLARDDDHRALDANGHAGELDVHGAILERGRDQQHHRTESVAVGHQRRREPRVGGGLAADRSDAHRHHVVAERGDERIVDPGRVGELDEVLDLRAGGEGHRVDPTLDDRREQLVRGDGVLGHRPAVHGDRHDLGPQRAHGVGERRAARFQRHGTVELHGDAQSVGSASRQLLDEFGRCPVRRLPAERQPGRHGGAVRLLPPGEYLALAQGVEQCLTEVEALGRLEPPPYADARREQRDVGRPGDDVASGVGEVGLRTEGMRADRRSVHDRRTLARQQLDLFVAATVGGHADHEARERADSGLHDAILTAMCFVSVSGPHRWV